MKKKYLILIFLFLFQTVYGQDGINVKLLNLPTKVKPNSFTTIFYEITNSEKNNDSLAINLKLPSGWQILNTKKNNVTDKSDTIKVSFTFTTPNNIHSGFYPIIFTVSTSQRSKQVEKIDTLKIDKLRNLNINLPTIPDYIKEGDTLQLEYYIQNLGNDEEIFIPKFNNGKILNSKDTIKIGSSQSTKILTKQIIPQINNNYSQITNELKLIRLDTVKPQINYTYLPVYSTKLKKIDPFLRFPLEAGIAYLSYQYGQRTFTGFQYFLSGRGNLDLKNQHFLDLHLRGPNRMNIPYNASYDLYSINYIYKGKNRLQIGDAILSVSNLLETGRFGRGVIAEKDWSRYSTKVYFINPRFTFDQKRIFGAALKYNLSDSLKFEVNFLSKKIETEKINVNSQILGVMAKFKKNKINWDSEIAGNYANGKLDIGISNLFFYNNRKVRLSSNAIYAGKNFYGFYNNSFQLINTFNYSITKQLGLNVLSNITRINPTRDEILFTTSPFVNSSMVGINYSINNSNQLTLNYLKQSREDRLEPKRFHYNQDFVQFTFNNHTKVTNIYIDGRFGNEKNLLLPIDSRLSTRFKAISFYPQVRPFPWIWIGGILDYQETNRFSKDSKIDHLFYYGGTVNLMYKNKINLSANYRNNVPLDELTQRRDLLNLALDLHVKNHRLTLTGGRIFTPTNQNENFNTLFFSIKYSKVFNIPLARKYRYSSISGQLLGSNHIIGKGGIIIQLGERKYLTDSTGKFYFDKLLPDSYYLTIDKKTLGQGVISTTKLPIQLALKADSTKNVSISLIKTGGLEGKVNLMTSNSIGNEVKEHPTILVRLFNEQESFLTQVSKTLSFSFKEMRPSDWQIEALLQSDEDKFTVIDPIKSIKIEADTVKIVDFTVKPIERKIYFSQNNFNLVTKKEEKKKDEVKVEPISKLKTKADSLNATSDIKKLKQEETKKPIKTVQNNSPKKTFDKVSVGSLKRKARVVIQTPKHNIWRGFDGKIVWNTTNKTLEQNSFNPNTSSNENTPVVETETTDTEPNRNLKNKERQR